MALSWCNFALSGSVACCMVMVFAFAAWLSFSVVLYHIIFRRGTPLAAKRVSKQELKPDNLTATRQLRTAVILGSGGHTSEMLKLLDVFDHSYEKVAFRPRVFFVADTDVTSLKRLNEVDDADKKYDDLVVKIPRAREVHQSWLSTCFSTLKSGLYCVFHVLRIRPDIILANGPGTCIPVCFAGVLLSSFCSLFHSDKRCYIIFIESFCRVKTLSMSAKIAYYLLADDLIVQWPDLTKVYTGTKYFGRLV